MRCKLMILSFVAVIGLCLSLIPAPADGDCSSGINKNHLDTTAKAFVDNETIEIDDANGLQVKDDGISGAKLSSGMVIQTVNSQTGSYLACPGNIPDDDTIPQNTEGTEVMTLAITPTSASNILKIEVVTFFTDGGGTNVCAALFQDNTASALACGMYQNYGSAGNHAGNISFSHYMTAGTASEATFKVRLGSSGNTARFNGYDTGRRFGGVLSSSITITEIKQ